mmetsp:Transcript_135828/g.270950  ORF Transcript_135828/g.270950 Transcript_135828/m.270950 type:complete len:85 (-) Transcript_135828:608-862(-)
MVYLANWTMVPSRSQVKANLFDSSFTRPQRPFRDHPITAPAIVKPVCAGAQQAQYMAFFATLLPLHPARYPRTLPEVLQQFIKG